MKYTKTVVDAELRATIFNDLINGAANLTYQKVNDRQYGVILTDKNGHDRYCRVGVIVAEERETMTARELMAQEIATYEEHQEKKRLTEEKKQAKILADKQRREAKEKNKKGEE